MKGGLRGLDRESRGAGMRFSIERRIDEVRALYFVEGERLGERSLREKLEIEFLNSDQFLEESRR